MDTLPSEPYVKVSPHTALRLKAILSESSLFHRYFIISNCSLFDSCKVTNVFYITEVKVPL